MRRPTRFAQLSALVAVCLCMFALPSLAVECPLLAGSVAGEPGEGIAVSGGYAYVGRSEYSTLGGGLDAYDVSDPTDPVLLGSLDASWFGYRIAVSGQYAFVAAGTDGLRVVDVSDPAMPVEVGNAFGGGHVFDVAVSGDYAFLIEDVIGLLVFDISTPPWPVMVGNLPLIDVHAIAVLGMYAYVAARQDGMIVVDVSDPSQPSQVTSVPTSDPIFDTTTLDIVGDYAFVGAVHWGPFFVYSKIYVIDISHPATPDVVGVFDLDHFGFDRIAVSQQYAYLKGSSDILVVDVETPSSPGLAGWNMLSDLAGDVAVSDGFVYVTVSRQLHNDESLVVFWDCALSVFGDGFESGDTSAWSASSP